MDELHFFAKETVSQNPSNENFFLHTHDDYEIYMFLAGDAKYIVEGNTYSLNPQDIIVIRKNEMHRVFHNSYKPYRRMVINVSPQFFIQHNCSEYEHQFLNYGTGNKINADVVVSSGIYNALERLKKFSDNFSDISSPVVCGVIIEILYLINKNMNFSDADKTNSQLENIIEYINSNYTESFSLDDLEKMFFISKYHLCRSFKKVTGLTVYQYIARKRITLVNELSKSGRNIGDAAIAAGFSSYSSFYRAYISEYGCSPRTGIKQ